jgi:Mrp family chromosome partitioning ATPase
LTDPVSFDVGPWTTADDWLSSSLVVGSTVQHAAPAEGARPEAAVADTVGERTRSLPEVPARQSPEPNPLGHATAENQELDVPQGWVAQWEVDEFQWPDELARLSHEQHEYFRYAGEKLRDASREGLKALAVVSTREREGCSTMAICLARAAAATGARVALVDANLEHPELGTQLGIDFSSGWQEFLNGTSTLADAAVLALESRLTLLPLSPAHQLPSLVDPHVNYGVRALADAFDLVILDAGPVAAGMAKFAGGSDCPVNAVLVVRDVRRTSEAETVATASRLKALGIPAIGIAENFLPAVGNHNAAA